MADASDDGGNLFSLLSDEVVSRIMGMMTEEELFVARRVCQRWWVLAQDPPLFRPQVQALGAAREELRAAMVRAEQQLVTLSRAIVDWYRNETTVDLIRSRMEEKSKALNEKVASFQVDELLAQVIATYPSSSEPLLIDHFRKRQELEGKLASQITDLHTFLSVNPHVFEMEQNPFVPTPYRTDLLQAVTKVAPLLKVTQASLDGAAIADGQKFKGPLLEWD